MAVSKDRWPTTCDCQGPLPMLSTKGGCPIQAGSAEAQRSAKRARLCAFAGFMDFADCAQVHVLRIQHRLLVASKRRAGWRLLADTLFKKQPAAALHMQLGQEHLPLLVGSDDRKPTGLLPHGRCFRASHAGRYETSTKILLFNSLGSCASSGMSCGPTRDTPAKADSTLRTSRAVPTPVLTGPCAA